MSHPVLLPELVKVLFSRIARIVMLFKFLTSRKKRKGREGITFGEDYYSQLGSAGFTSQSEPVITSTVLEIATD